MFLGLKFWNWVPNFQKEVFGRCFVQFYTSGSRFLMVVCPSSTKLSETPVCLRFWLFWFQNQFFGVQNFGCQLFEQNFFSQKLQSLLWSSTLPDLSKMWTWPGRYRKICFAIWAQKVTFFCKKSKILAHAQVLNLRFFCKRGTRCVCFCWKCQKRFPTCDVLLLGLKGGIGWDFCPKMVFSEKDGVNPRAGTGRNVRQMFLPLYTVTRSRPVLTFIRFAHGAVPLIEFNPLSYQDIWVWDLMTF